MCYTGIGEYMKTSKFRQGLLAIGLSGLLTGCIIPIGHTIHGNGKVISQQREAEDFDSVILDGVGNVNIHYSSNYKVKVTTDTNIQHLITIDVNNNILHIDENSTFGGFDPTKLVIDVYMPDLKNVSLKGVGDIKVIDGDAYNCKMNLSGVGNIYAQNFEVRNVTVTLSGVGDIKTWVTKNLTGSLSGVGSILYKGSPSTVNINKSGVGDIKKM